MTDRPFAERLRSELAAFGGAAAPRVADPAAELQCSEVTRATPIYLIGDSQTLIFRDRIYRVDDGRHSREYIARVRYCPGLCASNFTADDGALHPDVLSALRSELLIVDGESGEPTAIHRAPSRQWRELATVEDRPRTAPVVVFLCGSLDTINIGKELANIGTELPDEAALSRDPSSLEALVAAKSRVRPLERGLLLLKSWGLDRLFVHSVVPPQADDEAFFGHFGFHMMLRTRIRLLREINLALDAAARRANCTFIDTWPYTAPSEVLSPEYVHDSFHSNERAALITVKALMRALAAREPAS
jgi:hypothetical protein